MRVKRYVDGFISSGYYLMLKHKGANGGLRILLYHSVGSDLEHDSYGLSVSAELFRKQIRALSRGGQFEIVSLNSSTYYSSREDDETKLRIAITFDDGYRDVLYVAAPVLLEQKLPFTVFVTTKFIESDSSAYFNREELGQLSRFEGVTIGSHGMSHRQLTHLDKVDLRAELRGSRSTLEDIIGKQVDMVSYPHGKVDLQVRNVACESGYRLGAGSRFGINSRTSDPMLLSRTEIWSTDSENVFLQKCLGAWDWYGLYQKLMGM